MTTYRLVKHERDFTQIQNTTLRDERLSFRARGILAWLLSHVDTWEVSREQIARNGTEGVDAIRTAEAELKALGYLERVEHRTGSGRIYYVTNVYEVPAQTAGGLTANGSTANGSTANGESNDIEDHLPKDHLEEEDQRTTSSDVEVLPEWEQFFNHFWKLYPRKVGKPSAKRAMKAKYAPTAIHFIVGGTNAWVRYWHDDATQVKHIPHPATFLNDERYNNEPPPVTKPKQSSMMDSISKIRERDSV